MQQYKALYVFLGLGGGGYAVKDNTQSKLIAHPYTATSNGRVAGHWHLMGRPVNVNVPLIIRKAAATQGLLED